jgi:diaminopimelate epimerase
MILFAKYQGAGNDFVIIDDRASCFPIENNALIARLCHRQKGIGADGLILLQDSHQADFRMRIFNADGREAAMCGNGLRCLIHFIHALGNIQTSYLIETGHALYSAIFRDEQISIDMGIPQVKHWGVELLLKSGTRTAYVVHTGVPHAVIFVPDLKQVDLLNEGKEIRNHSLFIPEGVNVNFACAIAENEIQMRTYERGVEGETLACGTGAVAVAYVANQLFRSNDAPKMRMNIITASQDRLEIHKEEETEAIRMIGPAGFVFGGCYNIELL